MQSVISIRQHLVKGTATKELFLWELPIAQWRERGSREVGTVQIKSINLTHSQLLTSNLNHTITYCDKVKLEQFNQSIHFLPFNKPLRTTLSFRKNDWMQKINVGMQKAIAEKWIRKTLCQAQLILKGRKGGTYFLYRPFFIYTPQLG